MLLLSQVILQNPDIDDFQNLLKVVGEFGEEGQILLSFDLKPDYRNTPRDWQDQLENAFMWHGR